MVKAARKLYDPPVYTLLIETTDRRSAVRVLNARASLETKSETADGVKVHLDLQGDFQEVEFDFTVLDRIEALKEAAVSDAAVAFQAAGRIQELESELKRARKKIRRYKEAVALLRGES